jgi:hypothetical protein
MTLTRAGIGTGRVVAKRRQRSRAVRRLLIIAAAIAAVAVVVLAIAGRSSDTKPVARAALPFAVGCNESLAQTHHPADRAAWEHLIDADARLHHDVGSTVLRTVLHWSATEPRRGHFDFSLPDELVARYGAQGVRILFVLDGVPRWARGGADWRAFVSAVARRYAGRIVGLDVFNEPNYTRVPIAPARYARLLCAAHQAAAGRVPIGGGALANGPSLAPYLTAMLRAGAGRCMDALSFHPYTDIPTVSSPRSSFQRTFRVVRRLRDRYARGLPLWVTETGWRAAARPDEPLQARVLLGILHAVEAMPQHDVRLLLFHTLVGDPLAPGGPDYGIVALGPGGTLRPRAAYGALARELRG